MSDTQTPSFGIPEKIKDRPLLQQVTLPSRGFPYDGKIPEGKIWVSAMTTKEEKIFAGSASSANDKFNLLLNNCCYFGEGVHASDLLISDRFFVLIQIRALSYGNDYGFSFKCGECDYQARQELKIPGSLKLIEASDEDRMDPDTGELIPAFEEPFEVDLPATGHRVALKFLRGKDEEQIQKMVSRKSEKGIRDIGDPTYTLVLARFVAKIDGEDVSPLQALTFVENLIARDSAFIRNIIEERTPGYNLDIDITCPNCGYVHEERLPMGSEFFRPRTR
jgi:hypothetical protein